MNRKERNSKIAKIDMNQNSFSRSPETNELFGSTTINSSDLSALKMNIESTHFNWNSDSQIRRLKKKIYKLEQWNQQLENQVKQWREKYSEIKETKEKVRDEVIDQIQSKLIQIQKNHYNSIETNLKLKIEEITNKYNTAIAEKHKAEIKLSDLSEELNLLKLEQEQTNDSYEKKERLMRFALSQKLKFKLSEPIVRQLLSSVSIDPLILAKYFRDSLYLFS